VAIAYDSHCLSKSQKMPGTYVASFSTANAVEPSPKERGGPVMLPVAVVAGIFAQKATPQQHCGLHLRPCRRHQTSSNYLVGGWPTPLKNISQWEGLFPIYWKIKNVPNHQPVFVRKWLPILTYPANACDIFRKRRTEFSHLPTAGVYGEVANIWFHPHIHHGFWIV